MSNHKRRIPVIEQAGQTECGLCSLAMILSYYKCEYTIAELRDVWNVGRDGLNMLLIKKIAVSLGFTAQGYRINDIRDIVIPSILHIRNNHFVVVESVRKNRVSIVDPAKGRYTLSYKELIGNHIGIALAIRPTDNVEVKKIQTVAYDYLLLLKNQTKYILIIMLATLAIQCFSLLVPVGLGVLTDLLTQGELAYGSMALPAVISMIVINGTLMFIKSRTIVKLQFNFDQKLSSEFVAKFLRLPYSFFQKMATGDIVHRYTGAVIVRELLSNRIVSIWLDFGLIIIYLLYMWVTSIKLAFITTFLVTVQVLVSLLNINKNKKLQSKEVAEQANATNYFTEIARAAGIVKIKGAEENINDVWKELFSKQLEAMQKKGKFIAGIQSINQMLQFGTPLIVLCISLFEINAGNISIGTMLTFFTISSGLLAPVTSVVTTVNEVIYANAYFKRIIDILHLQEEDNLIQGKRVELNKASIRADNVSFCYGINGKRVINDVNLKIEACRFVGIVGTTGSGKSTLGMLLLGLEKPTSGDIYVGGEKIQELNKTWLRKRTGVVVQDMYLFNQSILDNIVFGAEGIREEAVIEACKAAEIYDEIMEMPMKFNTILSENGTNVSGGQRQRIALARALIGKPDILLLDEATSSLDTITERRIQKNLKKMKCTKIVVAHRLSTIVDADVIVVMENGAVLDCGTHKQLMAQCKYYAELYMKQKAEVEEKIRA